MMDRNILADSLTRYILETRRAEAKDFLSPIEIYNSWIQKSGYQIKDTQTVMWILDIIKMFGKSNLVKVESMYFNEVLNGKT